MVVAALPLIITFLELLLLVILSPSGVAWASPGTTCLGVSSIWGIINIFIVWYITWIVKFFFIKFGVVYRDIGICRCVNLIQPCVLHGLRFNLRYIKFL